MKKFILYGILIGLAGLMATTQALASPAASLPTATVQPQNTSPAPTQVPGATAVARTQLHAKPHLYRGTIAVVDSSSVALTQLDGSSVTIALTSTTQILMPDQPASSESLSLGMHVAVLAFNDAGNAPVAQMVDVIPSQPIRAHRVGQVTAYRPGVSITIRATDGTAYMFSLNGSTKILPDDQARNLRVGSLVTVVAPRMPTSQGWIAIGIVVDAPQ